MSVYPFQPRGGAPLIPLGWEDRVELAESESEVVTIAREFIAYLEPWEVAHLPLSCRPRKLFTANDVCEYAFDLARHEREHGACGPLIQRMGGFFARAAGRLSRLHFTKTDDSDEIALPRVR